MTKIFRISLFITIAVGLIFGGLQQEVAAQTPINNTICLLEEPDSTEFPDVSLVFRAADMNYQAMRNLTRDDMVIQENDQEYTPSRLSYDPNGLGLDLYFIMDRGMYMDVATAKAMINRYLESYGVDGVDRITILIPSIDTTHTLIKHSTSFDAVETRVNNYSTRNHTANLRILQAIQTALDIIRGETQQCRRPSSIIVMGATDRWSSDNPQDSIISTAINFRTPIHFMHYAASKDKNGGIYKTIAEATKGSYVAIDKPLGKDAGDLDDAIFKPISGMRGSFSVTYRSLSGASGKRDLALMFADTPASSDTQRGTFTVDLKAPKVTIVSPVEGSDVLRTATVFADPKFIYDKDVVPIEFKIEWPDGFERVPSKIRVIGTTSVGEQTIQEIEESEYTRSNYTLSWNVDALTAEGSNPFGVRVEVVDELGLQSTTTPSHFTVTNLISEAVGKQTTEEIQQNLKLTQYFVYVLAGIIALLIALVVIFRKKIAQAFSSTGKIGQAIETVRKTIVGGTGRRKNPIARLEVVRPTVEVKSIFTESVKLGRDPNISDYTFYSLNSDCSVSGEHAQLVKKRDGWRIIAVSHSGSPVFVDEQRIPMHQEIPLHTGQLIELGYQDLGSALFRFVEVASNEKFDFTSQEAFKPETKVHVDDDYRRTQVNIPGQDDSVYGGLQQQTDQSFIHQDFFASTSTDDDDFDALFNNLRDN